MDLAIKIKAEREKARSAYGWEQGLAGRFSERIEHKYFIVHVDSFYPQLSTQCIEHKYFTVTHGRI